MSTGHRAGTVDRMNPEDRINRKPDDRKNDRTTETTKNRKTENNKLYHF